MNNRKNSLKDLIEKNKEEILSNPALLDKIEEKWEMKKSSAVQVKTTQWK